MMARHARAGAVEAIFLRPERRHPVRRVTAANLAIEGLVGDHASKGKRALTLIQAEHLDVVAGLMNRTALDPVVLRRNVVVSGMNLHALRHQTARIGEAVVRITGPCPPCSRMEEVLGHGGYSAMRGHGGFYAEVLSEGAVSVGDSVTRLECGDIR